MSARPPARSSAAGSVGERAAQMVGEATAQPERGIDAEWHAGDGAGERLVEDEILDAQLDTLSAERIRAGGLPQDRPPAGPAAAELGRGLRDDARPAAGDT